MGWEIRIGAVACLVVGGVLKALQTPEVYQHRPMLAADPSEPAKCQFILCETEYAEPCSSERPVRWLADFDEALADSAGEVAAAGGRATLVHIGAHHFQDETNDYLPSLLAMRQKARVRLVLVEPEREHREALLQVHRKMGLLAEDVTVVSAAMNQECNASEVQYVFSDQLFLDFAPNELHRLGLRGAMRSWRTFDRDALGEPIRALGENAAHFAAGEGSAKSFGFFHQVIVPLVAKIWAAGNYSQYIVEERTPCLNASALMKEASLSPSEIVFMTVDAEGFDARILQGFVRLDGFKPTLQKWEGDLSLHYDRDPEFRGVVDWFRSEGYTVGATAQAHSQDVVAYFGERV